MRFVLAGFVSTTIFYCNSAGLSRAVRYNRVFVIAGFVSGVCFHIFYCNSAGLSNVVRYNGVFVI